MPQTALEGQRLGHDLARVGRIVPAQTQADRGAVIHQANENVF